MATLDLDALYAAREEATDEYEPKTITWKGEEYEVAAQPSLELVLSAAEGNLRTTLSELLGPDGYKRFMATDPPWDAFEALTDQLGVLYPGLMGKAPSPLGKSSRRTGGNSRATSNGSTGSTSPKPSSDNND